MFKYLSNAFWATFVCANLWAVRGGDGDIFMSLFYLILSFVIMAVDIRHSIKTAP
jgi:hypothetical protein